MSMTRHTRPAGTRTLQVAAAAVVACLLALAGSIAGAAPAHAASQGVGFGTWAPVSPYGWHGSMLIDGIQTYCILPGAPAPTGDSIDRGVSGSAAGLSPQQLSGINLLITKYGQTGDPVQAAAVGWAVKATANWEETLHHFGYQGSTLAGAINWTFSALAPEDNAEVQRLALTYYDEARSAPAGVATASGSLIFTTDAVDHRLGSVRVDASAPVATGTITLANAVFVDTGTADRSDAVPGIDYAIAAQPTEAGVAYAVSGTGRFTVANLAAVRHFTTAGGQDTAGPAGELALDVSGADTAPRVPLFSPAITTQVAARFVGAGAYADDVKFGGVIEDWPRSDQRDHLPVSATANVFRTDAQPALTDGSVPADALPVGSLALTTDATTGPTGTYRVTALWDLPGPGYYTAVWRIDRDAQIAEVAARLPLDYAWVEDFGEQTQVTMVPAVSSHALPTASAGQALTDTIIVEDPVPIDGLTVSSSIYRATDGVLPAEVCTAEHLVWSSEPHVMMIAGEHTVTAAPAAEPGTYFWQERAVDAGGELVHLGTCGAANETTLVTRPLPGSAVNTPSPSALAVTGQSAQTTRTVAGIAVTAITAGGMLIALSRRRRFVSRAPIG